MRLRLLCLLFAFLIRGGSIYSQQSSKHPNPAAPKVSILLDVDGALALRLIYADLLGKSQDVALERFGPPTTKTDEEYDYEPSPKTDFREVVIFLSKETINAVKIFAKPAEILPVTSVLHKAANFCFTSGVYENSTDGFLSAQTMDGKTTIQFSTEQALIPFRAIIFANRGRECNPQAVPYKY